MSDTIGVKERGMERAEMVARRDGEWKKCTSMF